MKMKVVLVASLVVMSLCSFFIGTVVGQQSVTWKAESQSITTWSYVDNTQPIAQGCRVVKGIGYLPAGYIDYRLNKIEPVHMECVRLVSDEYKSD